MKKIIILVFFLFAIGSSIYADDKNKYSSSLEVDRTYEDSIARKSASIGDIFIVAIEPYRVFILPESAKEKSFKNSKMDTLNAGEKFKVIDIVRVDKTLCGLIERNDGSKAFIYLTNLKNYCYKEGESKTPLKIRKTLSTLLEFRESPFWYILLLTASISIIFLFARSYFDKLFYKLSKREYKKKNFIMNVFLGASALFGALVGLTVLFYGSEFKDFFMYFPVFKYPSQSSVLIKFYWFLLPMWTLLLAITTYRNIREFGVGLGILASLIIIIPGMTIFWTSLVLSFIVVVGLCIMLIMSLVGTMAVKSGERSQSTVIVEEHSTFGQTKLVQKKLDKDGHTKSKTYV